MEMPSFEMTREQILKFLEELLFDGFNHEVCFLKITDDLVSEREVLDEDEESVAIKAADRLSNGQKLGQFGMQFLLSLDRNKAGLNDDIVRDLFYAICRINYYEPQQPVPLPEDGEEVSEEQKERFNEQNDEIERANELFAKLKNFVKLVSPQKETSLEEGEEKLERSTVDEAAQEKCLVRI